MTDSTRSTVYQAQIALPATLERIESVRGIIELAGGKVETFVTPTPGLTIVRLTLPESLPPEAVLPGVPFFSL